MASGMAKQLRMDLSKAFRGLSAAFSSYFRYSDWAYEPVKQSLYGLSSGTWTNQDIGMKEGLVPLHIQLMKDLERP